MLQLATFPEARLRSRTVGFPESGSGLGSARHFSGRAFPHGAKLGCWRTLRPVAVEFASPLRHGAGPAEPSSVSGCLSTVVATECPEPLCPTGVTRAGAASRAAWRGVTPSSSLVRAHAPDHHPPRASALALRTRSLQALARPCWAMALPDIISATLVQVLGPIPRRGPRLHLSIP
jgi:hypothetical protein